MPEVFVYMIWVARRTTIKPNMVEEKNVNIKFALMISVILT